MVKKTNEQVAEAAMEAAQALTALDAKAEKLSAISSGVKVEIVRTNVGIGHSDAPSYRIKFTEADRHYTTYEAMTRKQCSAMLHVLHILVQQNMFCGVATGGPMRFDRDDVRCGELGSLAA